MCVQLGMFYRRSLPYIFGYSLLFVSVSVCVWNQVQIVRIDVVTVVDVNRVTEIIERRQPVKWYVNCIDKSTQMNFEKESAMMRLVWCEWVSVACCCCCWWGSMLLIQLYGSMYALCETRFTLNHWSESNF